MRFGEQTLLPFESKFYELLADKVLNDPTGIWVLGEIQRGFSAYLLAQIEGMVSDANKPFIPILVLSEGGLLDESLASYSILRQTTKHKVAYIFTAFSGAVLISLAADERVGYPETLILLHDLSMDFSGKGEHFKEELRGIEIYQNIISSIIFERTKIPRDLWERKRHTEWYLDAKEALELGILTRISSHDDSEEIEPKPKKSRSKKKARAA